MTNKKFVDFNEYANDYRNIHNKNIRLTGADSDYFSEYKIREIKNNEIKNNFSAYKILDLGCGDGTSEIFLNQFFPVSKITGIDISKKSIEIAREKNINNCDFQLYNGKNIPFESEYFDIIFLSGVFHHIDKTQHLSLLEEIFRVLNNNGRLYLFEHNPFNPLTRKLVDNCEFDKDVELVSPLLLEKLVKKVCFKTIKVRYTLFVPRFNVFKKILFLENYLKWLPVGGQYYIYARK